MYLLSNWEMLHARMHELGKLLHTHRLLSMRLCEYALNRSLMNSSSGNTLLLLLLLLLCLLLRIGMCLQLCMRLLLCKLLR